MKWGRGLFRLWIVGTALFVLAAQATKHGVVGELPKKMVGSWCRETDNKDRDFFTQFGDPLLVDHEDTVAGEILEVCPMWMLWVWETGFSQSGEYCEKFEKIEETAPGVYLVHATTSMTKEKHASGPEPQAIFLFLRPQGKTRFCEVCALVG